MSCFSRLVKDVKNDLDTPDLWAELQRDARLLGSLSSKANENTTFTSEEQKDIEQRLRGRWSSPRPKPLPESTGRLIGSLKVSLTDTQSNRISPKPRQLPPAGDLTLLFTILCRFDAGLRRNEISEAKVEWVDLENNLLDVAEHENFVRKDGDNRTIPLTERFATFLKAYLAGRRSANMFWHRRKPSRGRASTGMMSVSGSAVTLPGAKSTPASTICADLLGPIWPLPGFPFTR
jgi:integrase